MNHLSRPVGALYNNENSTGRSCFIIALMLFNSNKESCSYQLPVQVAVRAVFNSFADNKVEDGLTAPAIIQAGETFTLNPTGALIFEQLNAL